MKSKVLPIVFILLIFIFPFRYAMLDQTTSNPVNLLCAVATIIGTLIFMLISITDSSKEKKSEH